MEGNVSRMNPQLRGVIFDLDGVLVSTDRLHFAAWKKLADHLALPFNETVNHQLRGVSREESLRAIYRAANRPEPAPAILAAQCAEKNAAFVTLIRQMTPADLLPGAAALLRDLRKAGILIGIASASRNCPAVLERTGLAALIDASADGNDVTHSKPDPAVFLLASLRLGLAPSDCLGVEDAATGIEAIRRAGMRAIGIGPAAGPAAHHTVPAIAAVSLPLSIRSSLPLFVVQA